MRITGFATLIFVLFGMIHLFWGGGNALFWLTQRGLPPSYSVYMMKAKAEAEAKEMQAKGMNRGEDFLDCK